LREFVYTAKPFERIRDTSADKFFTPIFEAWLAVNALPVCNAWNTLKVFVSGLKCFMFLPFYKKLFINSMG
jgi:hypothetical protein